ncbi:MAG TPA: conjugative transfer signal peptidase TraF [Bryobacteraceae bacterium]|nr:conjugative transfer signal peptidase TraF [Bryobacteraceae bacterium]
MTAIGLSSEPRERRITIARVIGLRCVIALFIGFQFCDILGLRINASPSLPLGLYVTSSEPGANLVEFCPAEPFASLALSRGYRDPGACSDGGAPLLKPVVARAGDLVEMSTVGIAVNGHLLPNTAPLRRDTKGRALTSWPVGRYTVKPGFVWVASSYSPRSFDSRYFGPVATSSIRDHVKPLLTMR